MTSLGEVARRPGVLFFKRLFSKPNSHFFFFFFFFWGGGREGPDFGPFRVRVTVLKGFDCIPGGTSHHNHHQHHRHRRHHHRHHHHN